MDDLIDEERFEDLYKDLPPDAVREVVEVFLRSTEPMVERVEHAAHDGDHEDLAAGAHRLKGGCLAVGAGAMSELSARIERDALAGSDDELLRRSTEDLRSAWDATRVEIQRRVDERS